MKIRFLAVTAGLALLDGCAVTPEDCEPSNRDASFATKLSCDIGGGYRAHIDADEQQVKLDQEENALFREIHQQISEQQRATRNELRVTNQQDYELTRNIEALVARLQQRSQKPLGLQHQINDLEQQLAADPEPTGNQPSGNQAQALAEREAHLKALSEQVNRLQQSLGYAP